MAAGEAVIRDRVTSLGGSGDVTEMTQKQTTVRVIVVGRVWNECVKWEKRKFCMRLCGREVRGR